MALIDTIPICCILLFILWQLYFLNFIELDDYSNKNIMSMTSERENIPAQEILTTEKISIDAANFNLSYNDGGLCQNQTIAKIKHDMEVYNTEQFIRNEHIFGPLKYNAVVIVVQTHDRIFYLKHLISSLSKARGISDVLLIFSHDYYDEEINTIVQGIDFCSVMQIFYPYSMQVYPNVFPGADPKDCPKDIGQEKAIQQKCNNAYYPDKYGNYREAKIVQTKHHWWWKANRIFSQLDATKYHNGLVLFLEEDHYVSEDFLHVLRLMEKYRDQSCPQCNVLALGSHTHSKNYKSDVDQVMIASWLSSKHNIGMAFNRSTWRQIVECATEFCKYDDYNWDWSLQYLSRNCMKQEMIVVLTRSDRVFHIGGDCGMHSKKNNCESSKQLQSAQEVLESAKLYLYPNELIMKRKTSKTKFKWKPNGGWGDKRDHELCLNMTDKL